ncbi:hypothetical protein RSAG8_12748, partial [Rhizoctonia solani AG-8 WAC10335]
MSTKASTKPRPGQLSNPVNGCFDLLGAGFGVVSDDHVPPRVPKLAHFWGCSVHTGLIKGCPTLLLIGFYDLALSNTLLILHRATSRITCAAYQASGMEDQYIRLEDEPREYIGFWKMYSAPGYMETISIGWGESPSGSAIQHTITTQNVTSLSFVGTSAESSGQTKPMERSQTTGNLVLVDNSVNFSSSVSGRRSFQGDNSYYFSPRHEVVQQLLAPPYDHHDQLSSDTYHAREAMSAGRADCLKSLLSLARPNDQLNRVSCMSHSPGLSQSPLDLEQDCNELDDSEDLENVQVAIISSLPLDRSAESNNIPFILQAHAIWMSHFLFEPLRVVQLARDYTFQTYSWGQESRWRSYLLANHVYDITRSTDYDLGNMPSFFAIHTHILRVLTEARSHFETSRELDRQYALGAMLNTYELISSLCQVASLSSVLSIMQLAAPVFRRACPDSLPGLINLPTLLATINIPLQYYCTLDVLLGVLTSRPMFFLYNVEFTPAVPESLSLLEDGPGLRWLYGVPDRLLLTLAKMNALFEEFGSRVPEERIDELEAEIKRLKPIVGPSVESALSIGRMVVQECWFLAALIYLYMGLCGANSLDIRVVKVRNQFMRILAAARPRRNPDLFLVSPMVMLGVATDDPFEQDTIRQRIIRISECSRPGTMGHDFTRMLDSVWATRRPTVWGDFRRACWEVSGM